jgi:hypothetical protein
MIGIITRKSGIEMLWVFSLGEEALALKCGNDGDLSVRAVARLSTTNAIGFIK